MSTKEERMNEGFSGINDALDTKFEIYDPESEKEEETTENLPAKVEETDSSAVRPHLDPEDEKYLTDELKENIKGVTEVMDTLADDITVGANARLHEVYAMLAQAKTKAVSQLLNVKLSRKESEQNDRKIAVAEKRVGKLTGGEGEDGDENTGTIPISPRQLADVMEQARKRVEERSEAVEVPAEFVEEAELEEPAPEEPAKEESDIPTTFEIEPGESENPLGESDPTRKFDIESAD